MPTIIFPGQGSQQKGMGKDLFSAFPELVSVADRVLGYSIEELCVRDPKGVLNETQYTQPALFCVNVLTWLQRTRSTGVRPDYVAGHSLGEYNALFAAEVIDFETGLRLVRQRGELMAKVAGGGMAAVIGLTDSEINRVLTTHGFDRIDIANKNTPSQFVISGPLDEIQKSKPALEAAGAQMVIPLRVSAPFHSRHMASVQKEFGDVLAAIPFSPPKIPVISNVEARPYPENRVREVLAGQITSSVQWTDTIRYLLAQGQRDFIEVGPGSVLSGLVTKIRQEAKLLDAESFAAPKAAKAMESSLGSAEFRRHYNLRYAYVAGSMYKGIASKELVVRMAKAGMLAFLGTGGLTLARVEQDLRAILARLDAGQTFGANLLSNPMFPELEQRTVDLYSSLGIRNIEAAGYIMMTPGLVRYRMKGLYRAASGEVVAPNSVLAKVSRPEVGEAFMSPPPGDVVEKLLRTGAVTSTEAELSREIPMAWDVCVECDSGGHTDRGIPLVLIPAMLSLRGQVMNRHRYRTKIRLGAAGGIGTPEAAAAAFMMGADFILTGSINQCTVEAGTSDAVKDMLQEMDVQHTDYTPAGDLFELGGKIQVLRHGVLFSVRANKLYDLYMHLNSIDQIDEATRRQIEEKYFNRTFEEVWQETRDFYLREKPDEIARAERNPKHKMGLIFRWYFVHTMRVALNGDPKYKVNYQVHTGPALGAFNRWVTGTDLQDWRKRHVDEIAEKLMKCTAELLRKRLGQMEVRDSETL